MGDNLRLLLHSGGLDSTCLATWLPPAAALTIDYGQMPANGEIRAARSICGRLGIDHHVLSVDCSDVGSGLLAGSRPSEHAPMEEWWPYRNQLLITLAVAWALPRRFSEIVLGSVLGDDRHRDGSGEFYSAVDALVHMQEGGIRVMAPALHLDSASLLAESELPPGLLGLTHSCHTSDFACGLCPGCLKRETVIEGARRDG